MGEQMAAQIECFTTYLVQAPDDRWVHRFADIVVNGSVAVAVARVPTERDLCSERQWLTTEQLHAADRLRHDEDRAAYVTVHSLLAKAMAASLKELQITAHYSKDEQGAPVVLSADAEHALRISLSHTRGFAAIAVSQRFRVGVDVENSHLRADDDLLQTTLVQAELARLHDEKKDPAAFLKLWSRKEAFCKALGLGLPWPPSRVDVSDPASPRIDGSEIVGSRIVDMPVKEKLGAAVCLIADDTPFSLHFFDIAEATC